MMERFADIDDDQGTVADADATNLAGVAQCSDSGAQHENENACGGAA